MAERAKKDRARIGKMKPVVSQSRRHAHISGIAFEGLETDATLHLRKELGDAVAPLAVASGAFDAEHGQLPLDVAEHQKITGHGGPLEDSRLVLGVA